VDLRLAEPGDAPAIAALSRTEIEHGLPWSWTPTRVANAVADRETNVLVAKDDKALVGFGIMVYRERTAHLCLLAVDPACRRRGLGSALLAWLERVAQVAGVQRLGLEARQDNAAALAFYRRHGYQNAAVVVGMYRGVEDGVRLVKWLA
jgi:ribosomal-protein-alanine N-acetyltransferase